MSEWLALATEWPTVARSLKVAAVVGALLIAINHGDAILAGNMDTVRAFKIVLTVAVPYLVTTYSSVGATLQIRQQEAKQR